ncbi:DUF6492 family protein [Sedimentitalea sp. HM32M-2]|uniref:DUF6492 family protein n=1 Tax=Sedimentitalea sp. HM32M-2 TaxID=3351566 RepID=UPI00363D7E33
MTAPPITYVTIVFQGDLTLLRLQAQSMARFLEPAAVSSILLVLNDVDEDRLRAQLDGMQALYGRLWPKVRIVSGDTVLHDPQRRRRRSLFECIYVDNRFRLPFLRRGGWRGGNGYRLQQALKLASARAATSERMVILDGKNIFLRAPFENELFDAAGRASATFEPVRPPHHRNWLTESLDVLDVPVDSGDISETTGYSTPYPVARQLLLDVLHEIETRHGPVQVLFASKRRPSEFMLIFAYCLKHFGGPDRAFFRSERGHVGLWAGFDDATVDRILSETESRAPLTFGLHRKAAVAMTGPQRQRILALFDARGLDARPVLADA